MKIRRRKMHARVEMTPLMDVVFLLLLFFIYSMLSMTTLRGMPLNLPASSQAELMHEASLSLSLTADGAIFLDKELLAQDELIARLRQMRAQSGEEEISLQVFADAAVSYQELYKVLDIIKDAGLSKITLQAAGQPTVENGRQ